MSISDEQLEQLSKSLQTLSGTIGSMSGKFSADSKGRKEAAETLASDVKTRKGFIETSKVIDHKMKQSAESFRHASSSADQFGESMKQAARNIPGGFLLSELLHYTTETVKTYKILTDVGQTFGGSMVQMSVAAGAAGLPLGDFAKAIQKNSAVVATLGQGFFSINKEVRRAAEGMGLYGMSLEQLNNFSGDYLEQQRLTGALTRAGQARQAKAINELAVSVSGVAAITGTARDTIMDIAQGAMRDPALVAAMAGNTAKGMHAYNDAINSAVTQLAAQAGPAGKFLSEGLAQSIAMGGAQFTDQANTMLEAGFGEGALLIQQAADKLAKGMNPEQVAMELTNSMKEAANNPATREALLNQARAGNKQAQEVLAMTQNLKTYTRAEMEAAKAAAKRKDILTGFSTAFESIFSNLKGSLVEGFLMPFSDALGGTNFEKTLENLKEMFKPLEETFKSLGKAWGENVKEFLKGDNLKNFVASIGNATQAFIKITTTVFTKENLDTMMRVVRGVMDVATVFSTIMLNVVIPIVGFFAGALKVVNNAVSGIAKIMGFSDKTSNTVGGIATAAAAGLAILIGKALVSKLMALASPIVNIKAGVVNLSGAGGMGGGGAGDFGGGGDENGDTGRGRGRGRGRRSAGRRMRAANRLGRQRGLGRGARALGMAGGLLGGAGRGIGRAAGRIGAGGAAKAGGKSLLKKIPGIGLLAGLGFGGMRALSGDWAGAGLEVASGAASLVPGVGTAASLGIDALLMGRDAGLVGGPDANGAQGAKPKSKWGRRLGMAGIGAAGLGLAGVGGMAAAKTVGNIISPKIDQVDTTGQTERMREATQQARSGDTMDALLAEMKKSNQLLGENRQISTAQLEKTIEGISVARGTVGAIEAGKR